MERNEEYIIDDTPVVIPDEIRKMPKEQLDAEIRQLEQKAKEERSRLRKERDAS